MAFQFVHVSSYSIKTGGADIADEAGRKPSHSKHVDDPKPPVLVAGMEPEAAWAEVERRHENARNTVTLKTGKTAKKRMRKDELVLLAAVASHPGKTEETDTDSPEFQDWMQRSIDWLTEQHGEPLSVVLHLDESHPHIHFLTAPDLEAGERMADIHPGERAKQRVGGRDAKKSEKDQAYRHAMRGYQNSHHRHVSVYHGLARLGPQKQRLNRAEWKAQQEVERQLAERLREQQANQEEIEQHAAQLQAQIAAERDEAEQAIQRARDDLEADQQAVKDAQEDVRKAKIDIAKQQEAVNEARGEVDTTKQQLSDFRQQLVEAKQELDDRVADVSDRERRLGGIWGKVVSAVTFGRMGTEKRVKDAVSAVRSDFQAKLDHQQVEADKAVRKHQKAVSRLAGENAKLDSQNRRLDAALTKSEQARQTAESALTDLQAQLKPLKAENMTLAGDRDELLQLLDSIENAAQAGDMAAVQDLLAGDASPGDTMQL